MLSAVSILLPVFGLIFAGFACRRFGVLGPAAASELNRFVVWLALPALLFHILAHASWQELFQPAFVAAFGGAALIVFAAVVGVRLFLRRPLADASIDGLAAAYPNTGYVGFPLCMIAFGPSSLTPTTIATILVVCVLFAIAIVLIETGLQSERRPHHLAIKVVRSLLRNPLLVAPALGAIVSGAHVALPESAETFLKLLGGAASPCALVSLGLFLAERGNDASAGKAAEKPAEKRESSWWLTLSKLVAQPALTWWLAERVFALPAPLVQMAVLLAALPTGTGPFMLAEYYRREAHVTSRTILHSTVGSLVTLTLLLLHLQHGG
jgi:malonate transporter and related proteins